MSTPLRSSSLQQLSLQPRQETRQQSSSQRVQRVQRVQRQQVWAPLQQPAQVQRVQQQVKVQRVPQE
jgi:hypothetical protein